MVIALLKVALNCMEFWTILKCKVFLSSSWPTNKTCQMPCHRHSWLTAWGYANTMAVMSGTYRAHVQWLGKVSMKPWTLLEDWWGKGSRELFSITRATTWYELTNQRCVLTPLWWYVARFENDTGWRIFDDEKPLKWVLNWIYIVNVVQQFEHCLRKKRVHIDVNIHILT